MSCFLHQTDIAGQFPFPHPWRFSHAGLSSVLNCTEHTPPPACALTTPLPRMPFILVSTAQPSAPPLDSKPNVTFSERSVQKVLCWVLSLLFSRVPYNCSAYVFLLSTYYSLKLTYFFIYEFVVDLLTIEYKFNVTPILVCSPLLS